MQIDKRVALRDAAIICFSLKGLKETRIEDITNKAGVGKGTFYHYFKSKTEVLMEVMHESIDEYHKYVLRILSEEGTVEQKIKKCIDERVSQYEKDPRKILLIIKIHEKGEFTLLGDKSKEKRKFIADPLYQILKQGKESIDEEFIPYLEEIAEVMSVSLFIFKEIWIRKRFGEIDTEEKYQKLLKSKDELDTKAVASMFYKLYVKGLMK